MYSGRSPRQKMLFAIVLCVIVAASILAACGTNSSNGAATGPNSSSNPSPTISPTKTSTSPARSATTPTKSVVGYGTANGCPSDIVMSSAPAAPDITVLPRQGNRIIDVRKGNVIEIQMPFGLVWRGPTTSQGVLQLQTPFGYAWKPSNACIWRFVASDSGSTVINFSGRPICKKTSLCVPAESIALFNFKVS
jgi:hypothetical protein